MFEIAPPCSKYHRISVNGKWLDCPTVVQRYDYPWMRVCMGRARFECMAVFFIRLQARTIDFHGPGVYSVECNSRQECHTSRRKPILHKQVDTMVRSIWAIDLLARSVAPSVWGWNTMDMRSLLPISLCSSFQNMEVNLVSWSDTMDSGIPWSLMTSSSINHVAPLVVLSS